MMPEGLAPLGDRTACVTCGRARPTHARWCAAVALSIEQAERGMQPQPWWSAAIHPGPSGRRRPLGATEGPVSTELAS